MDKKEFIDASEDIFAEELLDEQDIELNDALLRQNEKDKRRSRIRNSILKRDARLRIINRGNEFDPIKGYVYDKRERSIRRGEPGWLDGLMAIYDEKRSIKTLHHSGKYIKYPKNSKRQRWLKHQAVKVQRRHEDLPVKGNYYKKIFDYNWNLY